MARKLGDEGSKQDLAEKEAQAAAEMTRSKFLEGVRKLNAMNEACRIQNDKRRSLRKQLKADGFTLGAMDAALKMAEWDRSEIREHFDTRKQYAAWLGLPTGTQADLFKGLEDDKIRAQEWRARGATACLMGQSNKPPEECPPMFHQDFMSGFADASDAEWDEAGAKTEKPSNVTELKPKAGKTPETEPDNDPDPQPVEKDPEPEPVAAEAVKTEAKKTKRNRTNPTAKNPTAEMVH